MNDTHSDRSAEITSKQERLSALAHELERDGLLLLDPANFAWLTGGACAKGVIDPADLPAIYLQNSHRWLLCCNVDTQRLFDEELDGLGFQLKEWPWHWGRSQLLADLCHGKKVASDLPVAECTGAGEQIRLLRRSLNKNEQARLWEVGKSVAHALEATCRNLEQGESEEEVAGQIAHRLVHHGLEPVTIQVAADGRMRGYRRPGTSAAQVNRACILQTTARKWGLHVTASRCLSFGPADDEFRKELDAACRLTAVQIAGSIVGASPVQVTRVAQQVIEPAGFGHEWRLVPAGWVTGYAPVEMPLTPGTPDRNTAGVRIQVTDHLPPQAESTPLLEAGWALTWQGSVGATACADTILVTDAGPQVVTPAELWPVKRLRVSGTLVERPDVLVR
jgi:Xaa-Pro dipeptidase